MTAYTAPQHPVAAAENHFTADDFETASARSAAPSYTSEAPSYHSTAPPDSAPPYVLRSSTDVCSASYPEILSREGPSTVVPPPRARQPERQSGLPPVSSGPMPKPSLSAFAIPTWSNFTASPATRHYHSVAQRRVAAANDRVGALRRQMLNRVLEEEEERVRGSRPLEDPYLVGEDAARRARAERMARERGGDALISENRQWDWYMSQTRDMEERQRSWTSFKRRMDVDERRSFVRRIRGRLAF